MSENAGQRASDSDSGALPDPGTLPMATCPACSGSKQTEAGGPCPTCQGKGQVPDVAVMSPPVSNANAFLMPGEQDRQLIPGVGFSLMPAADS